MAFLRVFEDFSGLVRDIPLNKREILIGRDGGIADIQLRCNTVSRSHAWLKFSREHWYLEDAGSRAGTVLNNKKIKYTTIVRDGSTIQLGNATIEFHEERLESSSRMVNSNKLDALTRNLAMSFRPMPKAIRILARTISMNPQDIFEQGDTLLVGDGGVALTAHKEFKTGTVIELAITSPHHPSRSFIGEIIAVLDQPGIHEMCIKLHDPKRKEEFKKQFADCKRGAWICLQEGIDVPKLQRPRSSLFD